MRYNISAYLDDAITFLLLVVAGLTPILFFNQTTEFYEMPKLIFLIMATLLLFGLWIFSWIIKGKIIINRTPLDIPLLFMLGVILISTWFSLTRYSAIYGNFPRVHGSTISWVIYILLYFVTVSNLKTLTQIKTFLYVLYGSALLIVLATLLSFFHVFFPFDFAQAVNFTPTGSSFSTVAFLLLLLPLPLLSLIHANKYLPVPFAILLATLFGITIVLIGSFPSLFALLIAIALCVFVAKPHRIKNKEALGLFLIPVIVVALTFTLSYLPLPGGLNKLQKMEANFPKEIQLPFDISWKVSASVFRDAPIIGTGPSSYLFNFTTYKPAEFNFLRFWNFSFDTAYNEYLQTLGTLGILGLSALVILCLVIFANSWRNLSKSFYADNPEAYLDNTHVLLPALAISGLLTIVLLAIHVTTLVSVVATFFILAALMMAQKPIREKVTELSIGIKASTADNKQFDLFPIIVFVVYLVIAIPVLYKGFNIVAADYYHRQALSQANRSGTLTYQYLQKAEALNPQVDLYRVDLAQTNFALANAIALQKGPSKTSPNGSLTDQDKQTIQTLLSQAINEGRISVALSPRSSRNWEVLASIYRNIAGVAKNALPFSLDAYGRAIQRDPLNPILRLNVGGIYYAAKNYDLAIRFFTDAANLKPDYANAYYNLSIALRDKGDIQNAAIVAQQTVNLLQANPNTPDYQIAAKLLSDLKAKAANVGGTAPAGQTTSALGNPSLPNVNVSNLGNPPQVATPPAVTNNPNVKLPFTTPSLAKPANR